MRRCDLQLDTGPDPAFTPRSEFATDDLCALAHAGQTKVSFATSLSQDSGVDAYTIINYSKPEFLSLVPEMQPDMLRTSVAESISKGFATDTHDFVNSGSMQAGWNS